MYTILYLSIFFRSSIDIEQVVVSRQDMKLLEVLAGRVREERREEEVMMIIIVIMMVQW